jgi:sec-independent protein translocase protein TatC
MIPPGDTPPGGAPVPRPGDARKLTDEQRAALGEPPGRSALEARMDREEEDRMLARIQHDLDEVEAFRMPLMDHLIELKDRLLWSLLALTIGTGIGFYNALAIYDFLTAPFNLALSQVEGIEGSLSIVHSPFEGVFTYLKVSFIAGMVFASPVISYQAWQFIAPGLYRTERGVVLPLSISSVVLFMGGAAFCYYGLFPFAFPFFIEVLGVDVNLSADGYLSAVLWMMMAFGACFQLPVGAWFFARIGLIDHIDMMEGFRYAVVVIFVVAAILTPPDPITQILLAVPMVMLYGLGIVIARFATTKKR